MKKGISYWAFSGAPYEKAFAYAKSAGFDCVEATLDSDGELTPGTSDKDILKIGEYAKNSGIGIQSLATGLFWQYPLTDNSEKTRSTAKDILRRELEAASLLGCDTVLVVPASVNENVSYDTAYARAFEAISEAAEYAKKCGVCIGIENVWNKFLLSPLEYKSFIDGIGSEYVGAYFDIGNVVYEGYPEQWINILGKRIKKIHVKDYKREIRTLAGFCDIGDGDVDFSRVITELRAIGYDSTLTAEVFPNGGEREFETVDKAAAAYKKIFKNI